MSKFAATDARWPCRARGCTATVQTRFLMCTEHWTLLPPELRALLGRTEHHAAFNRSQRAILAYQDAVRQAIEHVAYIEEHR